MTHFKKTFIATVALLAMSVSASQANADSYRHIQSMALDIQLKSDALMGETHHYVHTPNYQRMIRSISDMRARAVRVHVLSLQRGCLITMAEDLRLLDAQYHAIEAMFDGTEGAAQHGYGHVHGATNHVKDHLKSIENDIHHIRDDISKLTRSTYRQPYSSSRGNGYSSGYRSGYSSGYGQSSGYRSHPRSQIRYRSNGHGNSKNRGHGNNSYRGYGNGNSRSHGVKYNSRAGVSYSDDNFSIRIGF